MTPMLTIEDVIEKVKAYRPTVNAERLMAAYHFAERAHAGQTRMSGEAYISHPLAVTNILADYKADEASLIAALLHDVVEDTEYKKSTIEKDFGKEVAQMVDALTKLPQTYSQHPSHFKQFDFKIETIRKIFELMQKDVRIIVIKLCDRLHNMKTLHHFRPQKQQRIAQETHDIFVKIADRLCIYDLKEKLERLCIRFLYPDQFEAFDQEIVNDRDRFERNQKRVRDKIQKLPTLKKHITLYFRQRPLYNRMVRKNCSEREIRNEVILTLPSVADCFAAIEEIHANWKHLRGNFRDYISLPKSNGYQALETSILKGDGTVIRFIIQTAEMNEYARNGVMLQCFDSNHEGKKIQLAWVQNLKRIHKETKDRSSDYMVALQNDILKDSMVVYTKDEKVVILPPKSTALDVAFYHLGEKAFDVTGIIVNQKKVPFSFPVKDRDTVRFETNSKSHFEHSWIYEVHSAYARSFVKERVRSLPKKKKVEIGRTLLEEELSRKNKGYVDEVSTQKKEAVAKKLGLPEWDDVYTSLAEAGITAERVCFMLFPEKKLESVSERPYLIEVVRTDEDYRSMNEVFSLLEGCSATVKHLQTKSFSKGFKDRFVVSSLSEDLRTLLASLRSQYRVTKVQPYAPDLFYKSGIMLVLLIFFWSVNPFVVKYLIGADMLPVNISALKMLSGGLTLLIFALCKQVFQKVAFERFRLNLVFLAAALFMTVDFLFSHFALARIPSSHFISTLATGHVFVFFFFVLKASRKSLSKMLAMAGMNAALAAFALMIYLYFSQGTPEFIGYLFGIAVLFSFFLHSYLNAQYQKSERVKDRVLKQLAYMFLFGAILHIPFMNVSSLMQASPFFIGMALLNGIFTAALGNYFYVFLIRYADQHVVNLGLSFILPIVFVFEVVMNGFSVSSSLVSLGAIYIAVLLTALLGKRAQSSELLNQQQLFN